jgi:MFS transporter, DHA2 family, multidrug resistance protein
MTLFGVAAMIAPIVGPTLGGWLCVNYNWRWIFLVNVPIGLFALVAAYVVIDDPDYLQRERAGFRGKPLSFDSIGLSLLVLVMCCWEIMLSKGKEWDWLGDPFWRLQTLLILFVVGLVVLIVREMRCAHPITPQCSVGYHTPFSTILLGPPFWGRISIQQFECRH